MWAPLKRARVQRRIGLGLACTALIALAVVLWRNHGDRNDAASLWISVVSAVVSVCAFAADLLRGPDGGHARSPRTRRQHAADALAEAVEGQWAREAQLRRLQDPAPLDVGWSTLGPPLADHRENVLRGRPLPAPRDGDRRLARIVEVFTALPSRRLVVLGEPGAGKTILAVQFVLGMLAVRRPGGPVPVLFPLAGWDPGAVSLREWLAERLAAEYRPLAAVVDDRTLARELLDSGFVLAVLDGFDELPQPAHGDAVRRLNAELDDRLPVLLTCRTAAWTRAVASGDVLTAAEVVRLDPLDPDTARTYLERTARPDEHGSTVWTSILRVPPEPLAEVLRTPLMVALARTVYEDASRDPAELANTTRFPTARSIEEHLLDAFVPAAFSDTHDSHRRTWQPDAAHRWLRRLALDLGSHDGTHGTWRLAWWQLPAAMPRPLRVLGPAVLSLLATAAVLVPLARFGGGVIGDWDSPLSTLLNLFGDLTGLAFGLAFLLPAETGSPQGPRRLARMALTLIAAAAVVAVFLGLLCPPVLGLRLGRVITPRPAWFLNGCCYGLVVSMMFAAAGLPRRPPPLGLPWAGSSSGSGAVRLLGVVATATGIILLVCSGEVLWATTALVAGVLLFVAGQRHGERVAAAHTTFTAMLKGFAGGLLRGFLVCTLIGLFAATVVGGITGLFAAQEFRWAPRIPDSRMVEGWRLEKAADGVRTATSTTPYLGELLFGGPGEVPLAVPRHARIARGGRRWEPFRQEIRVRMEREGPVLTAPGLPRADAWNVALELPWRAQLWLAERPALVIVRDAMMPILGFGALVGVIGGCASGVYRALSIPSDTMRAAGPRSTLRTDRAATLARGATAAVLAGGICWAVALLIGPGSPVGTMPIELWVPVGTSALALSAWGRLGIARIWLALTGRAPWRLMGFLAEAHRRGVLRQSGAHYEFRHLRLQQRLAGTPDSADTPR
ncbi:NACHT domain-containing NTPase, partial [Streptomyces sp. UNOB3_S3]|uniref:NACHT domain-containing protein n=1 Tax=Streptomyces sp. UNOB3_S3 TaxID=2871682 RepID=UPI001E53E1A6